MTSDYEPVVDSTLRLITPEWVQEVAIRYYRLSLDSERDQATFDELPWQKKLSRTKAFESVVRKTLVALGHPEIKRGRPAKEGDAA